MENDYSNQDENKSEIESTTTTTSETTYQAGSSGSSSGGATDKKFREASPEEVKHKVKETVQKGVAAVAGALKGFSEEAKKHNLADSTKEAINKAGETTRQVVGTTAKEFQKTKEHVKEQVKGGNASSSSLSGGSMGASGSSIGSLGGSSTMDSGSSSVRGTSQRENAMQDVSDSVPENKAGTTGIPDLRKTNLGKSDKDLKK